MSREHAPDHSRSLSTLSIVVAGVVSLAVAMGIGRFAFTPLLPLMLRDGAIDAGTGADWAAANYVGYLLGALTASRLSHHILRALRAALLGVVASTVLAAFVQAALLGGALRFAAGVFSAWVLVLASSWCLAALARNGASRVGAWIYTGVGIGIFFAGLVAWLGGLQAAWLLWIELGLMAAIGTAYTMLALPRTSDIVAVTTSGGQTQTSRSHTGLVICYGVFGFGYIVPATFLPALARDQTQNPLVFGLTWPLFGLAAALSVAIVARVLSGASRRRVWAIAQATMAVGTGLPALSQSLWSLTLSALLVGGTFMIATMAGLQMARELASLNPTPLLARMTAAFASGQIAGPVLVRLLGTQAASGTVGMTLASAIAALSLAVSALWLWRGKR
jgi:MFS family permease